MANQNKSKDTNESECLPHSLPAEDEDNSQPKAFSERSSAFTDLEPDQNATRQTKRKNSISPLSIFTTALIFAICLATLIALIATYTNAKKELAHSKESITSEVPKSLKGSLLQLNGIKCGWELSPDLESLDPPSAIVPVIIINETKGNNGYLQVIFKDPKGNIQGDPNTFQYISKNNSFVDHGDNRLRIRSTSGLNNMLNFSSYKIADSINTIGPWSATIMESGPSGKWSTLAIFEIPGKELSDANQ